MRWLLAKPAAWLLAWSASAGVCLAFTVTNSQNLTTNPGNRLAGAGEEIAPGGSGTPADPWVYRWTNVSASLSGTNWTISSSYSNSFALDLNGGAVVAATGDGLILSTEQPGDSQPSGSIAIRNAGDVALAKISTRSLSGNEFDTTGDITLGESTNRVGNIRVKELSTSSTATFRSYPGRVTIHSAGNVRIEGAAGEAGKIWTDVAGPRPLGKSAGPITVRHDGDLVCSQLLARGFSDNMAAGGSILCNGDVLGDGPNGDFRADQILTYQDAVSTYDGYRGGDVTITGYVSVAISSQLHTYSPLKIAGQVSIQGIRDSITIAADVDLHSAGVIGNLRLGTTAAAGKIEVGSSTDWGDRTLDLNKMGYILFDGPQKGCVIYQSITNFVPGSPNTQLRVQKDGHYVLYAYKRDGVNYDLYTNAPSGVYQIKSESGGVGWLKPLYSKGTIVTFK